MGSGSHTAGSREPSAWRGPTGRTWGEVDTGDRWHPRHHTWWVAWGGRGGLAQACSTAAQRPCVVAVGEEAVVPETHAAAGEHMPEDAADTCVGVARQGLRPRALTTVPGGTAAPPIAAIQDAGGRPTSFKTCFGPAQGAWA
jgi:hypothetical protein